MSQREPADDTPWIKKADELEALFQLTDGLYRAESETDAFDATFDAIERALGCSRASILLFDRHGVMRFVASRGLSEDYRRAVDGHSPWKPGDRDPIPIFVSDIELSDEPQALKNAIRGEGIRSLAFIPVTVDGIVVGKFMTYRDVAHVYSADEATLCLTIARQLGFSIERKQSEEAHQRAEEGLRRTNERLRVILDSASEYAIITLDADGRIASWNSGAERLLGYLDSEVLGLSGSIFFSPEDRALEIPQQEMRTAAETGRAANERWHYRKDGSRFWGSGVMLRVEESGPDRYLKIFRDRTEERRAEKRQKLLVGELNHRVKNTLATVNSLAEQTLKSSETPEAFAQAFNTRLLVLAKAHDLLTREAWQAVNLSDIAQTVLTAWIEDGRVSIQGAAIRIDPKKALALSMAFNELLTNAIKHGSLSNQVGRVALSWQCQEVCSVLWEERGGPPTSEPDRQGFGLRVLNRGLAHELGYPVELRFEPDGLTCTMSMDFSSKQPSGAQ